MTFNIEIEAFFLRRCSRSGLILVFSGLSKPGVLTFCRTWTSKSLCLGCDIVPARLPALSRAQLSGVKEKLISRQRLQRLQLNIG